MTQYQHPPAFRVLRDDPRLGPYHAGAQFSSHELTPDEGQRYIDEGILEGIDAFGDPFVHPAEAMAFDEMAPVEEPIEDTEPAAE